VVRGGGISSFEIENVANYCIIIFQPHPHLNPCPSYILRYGEHTKVGVVEVIQARRSQIWIFSGGGVGSPRLCLVHEDDIGLWRWHCLYYVWRIVCRLR
jgi:hypothetical protein